MQMPSTPTWPFNVGIHTAFDGAVHDARRMLVFPAGDAPQLEARTNATLLLLGGAKIPAPHMWWNFVSSRKERIVQAADDWEAGRFTPVPGRFRDYLLEPPAGH